MKSQSFRSAAAGLLVLLLSCVVLSLSGCGSGSSAGSGTAPTPTPQALAIISISPKEVPAGATSVAVTVTGTGFSSGSVIVLGGVDEPTTFVSATQVQATVPAAQLLNGKVLNLSVRNGTATADADPTTNLQVDNPVPTIGSVSPGGAVLGSGPVTVTVNGGSFISGAIVSVNGNPRATTFVSATQVTAALPATDLAGAGSLLLNVINPQPGGGASGTTSFVVNNPQPAVSALSPAQVQVGSAAGTLSVSGSGFVPGSNVLINGANRPTTFVSGTLLTAALSAADQATASSLPVTVVSPAPGGGVSNSSALSVNNPVPGSLTLSPTTVTAGVSTPTVLNVTGSGFVASTIIQVNGSARPTTVISGTALVATLSAADQASGGVLHVTAVTPAPGGGTSGAASLAVNNPAPGAISVSPDLVGPGTTTATPITVTGTNFVLSTMVQVNGSARATTFISSTQLVSALSVQDQASAGSLVITTSSPAPGGGTSTAAHIAVNNPPLGAISLAPTVLTAGTGKDQTVLVSGTGFLPNTVVEVNGSAHATTYVSSTQLSFVMPAKETASAAHLSVLAADPPPVANLSPYATLTISAATQTPVLSTVNPTSLTLNSPDTLLSVTGNNFDQNSVVQWNGSALVTSSTYSGGTYTSPNVSLVATVPASFLTTTGTATITVSNPTAPMPVSNALTVDITPPPAPMVTSIYPNTGAFNTDVKITLSGTGFTSASTVTMNGQPVSVSATYPTSLTVELPASALPVPGNYLFTVTTPAPGGGTSAAVPYTAFIPLNANNVIYNPTDGLLYASVPGSAGAALGNSVVSVNPATGALGTPIFVGSEPNKLALTSDGRFLWVGLDGGSAVRKVDLVAKTAGLQFSLPNSNAGIYNGPPKAYALAALPGATDSVVVALSSSYSSNATLSIFDNGVARANSAGTTNFYATYNALQIDSSRAEIYAGGYNSYATYTYNANGVTKLVVNNNISPASSAQDEMQLLSGKLITDFGKIYDPESGALLGTLYLSGQNVAQGATLADAALNKIFVLDSATGSYGSVNQIQLFNLNDYSSGLNAIPVGVLTNFYATPHRLVRWGANGLAFQDGNAIYSLQSNLANDLSANKADVAISLATSGATTTGGTTTFTATVTNNGPATATDVVLTAQAPSSGVPGQASASAGSCTNGSEVSCALGNLSSGSTVTVTVPVLQTAAGTSTLAAQVMATTTETNTGNNVATASVTITGDAYNVAPVLSSVSPAAIQAGIATDTTLTVNGSGFTAGSTVNLGATALTTSFVSATKLTATVPSSSVTTMGWSPVTVVTPAPGGGTSAPVALTIYNVLTVGVNHLLYDPFSRQIMASVGSGSSTVSGNSLAAIDPAAGTIGTPVSVGSQPDNMALSSDGRILYVILSGSQSVARYNMLSGSVEYTYQVPTNSSFAGGINLRGVAVQPGTEDTVALDIASFTGNAIYDFDPANQTARIRGQASGPYSGSCIAFLTAQDLLAVDTDTSGATLDHYTVTASGFTYYNYSQYTTSTINNLGCFKLSGGLVYGDSGGIANPATVPATQLGILAGPLSNSFSSARALESDASLQRAFYPAISTTGSYSYGPQDGFTAFNLQTFLPTLTLPLNMQAIEGSNSYNQVDLIRWGQDGLAILTSTGHIYLLRGPVIVPALLQGGGATAALSSVSSSTLATGSGNTLLRLTGSGFAPGVAVTWNGAYRTTTIQDATHVTVAVPASDLAAAGTASLVATNPGGAASNGLTVRVQ